MKAWKFLSAPLMLMLLACLQGNASAADVTEPVSVPPGESATVGNVTVENQYSAVEVWTEKGKDASVEVDGNVTLTNPSGGTAVYTGGYGGKASADISGDISATTESGRAYAVAAESGYDGFVSGSSDVKVGGNVSANSSQSEASGVCSYDSDVTVDKDINVEGPRSLGVEVWASKKANVDVKGNVDAKGGNATGAMIGSYGYFGDFGGNLSLNVGNDISATAENTENESENSDIMPEACGIRLSTCGGKLTTDVAGNIVATNPKNGNAVGLWIDDALYGGYTNNFFGTGKSSILVHNDIVSDGVGICREFFEEETPVVVDESSASKCIDTTTCVKTPKEVDVLVEHVIDAKDVGVLFRKNAYETQILRDTTSYPDPKLNLTVWKIELNERGNVAEWETHSAPIPKSSDVEKSDGEKSETKSAQDRRFFNKNLKDLLKGGPIHSATRETSERTAATDFEKKIMYIIKVEQPGEGGTIKAVDKDGKDLLKSYDFDVAHEDEKVMLKANLEDGYKLVAAYNGEGEKVPLSQDENGNYYIIVPKGGGVYLSVELEGTTEHGKADADDNTTSLDDETQESGSDSKDEIKPLDTDEKATSSTAAATSNAIKTGDVTQVAPWLVLSVVSAGGIMSLGARGKREDKE